MKKHLLLSLLISLSLLSACQSPSSGTLTLTLEILGNQETSTFQFNDVTLLDVLQSKYNVTTKKSLFTTYVKCINNICSNDEYSWVWYLNGSFINYGADIYNVQDGDEILFAYKEDR